jgi:predicted TPR repeat methyltransferase
VLRDLGRSEEAVASADQALALRPGYLEAHLNRAHALDTLKRRQEAIISYRNAIACGGNEEELHYYLAALGAEAPPALSPPSYIENLFDNYAERFDSSLLSLGYGVPERLFKSLVSVRAEGGREIVDLGCGTGMCGPFLRTIARNLIGVDLSAKMLEKAAARAVYDRLVKSEMVDFLRGQAQSLDLLVAADVFIYLGELDHVFAAAQAALRRGGQLSFSVEASAGNGFTIRPSRRYAHSLSYLRQLTAKHGFVEHVSTRTVVRLEEGQEVEGFILVLERG